jgi:hypothetical protein
MPRPRKPEQVRFVTRIDKALKARFDKNFLNPATGKLPPGTYQKFLTDAMNRYLDCFEGE